jgi:4-aminobutyrate aminotransferase-like enzyme
MEQGLLTDWFLFANHKIRIAPPLTITFEEIEFASNVIVAQLNAVYA